MVSNKLRAAVKLECLGVCTSFSHLTLIVTLEELQVVLVAKRKSFAF